MEFTVYTLGDVELFRSALNGVAMMFTVARGGTMDIWASNTGWGLGLGALLGALMALLIMVYNGALKRQLDWRNLLIPLLLYYVLTVPKATVVIMDSYSKSPPSTVDNVPLGLAFPLGIISQITHSATVKLETVFYVPYDGFTKITDEGYVAPLKLLNSIRYTGITASGAMPHLQEAINEAHHICLINNTSWDVNEYKNSINSLGVFTKALQSRLVENRYVKVPTANAGYKVFSCPDVAVYIEDGINAYITGTNSGTFHMLSAEQLKSSNLKSDAMKIQTGQNGSKQGLPDMSTAKIIETLANITQADNATIMQFMQQTILNPTLSAVTECAIDSDPSSQGRCSSYYTSVEQWKEKAAADASGFVAIMRDGQNLLIVLSIILFPIMVVILVLQGQSAMKILASYILYTVSAFMWLPVASIINFYTHLQLHEELEKWNPTGDPTVFLSLKNAPAFYDAISKKLSLANHALASVPMLCMGIFSGMLMTMNRLSDRWNTQSQYYDPKTNVPDVVKRSPVADIGPSYSADGMNSVLTQKGVGQAWSAETSKEMSNTLSQVEALDKKNSEITSANWRKSDAISKEANEQRAIIRASMQSSVFSSMSNEAKEANVEAVLSDLQGTSLNTMNSAGSTSGNTKLDGDTTATTYQGGVGVAGGMGQNSNGGTNAKVGVAPSGSAMAAKIYTDGHQHTDVKSNANQIDRLKTDNTSSSYKNGDAVRSGMSETQNRAFQRDLNAQLSRMANDKTSQTYSAEKGKAVSEDYSTLLSNQQAIQEKTGMAFKQSMSSTEMANRQLNNPTFAQNADKIHQQVNSTEEGREQFKQAKKAFLAQGSAESSIYNQQDGEHLVNNIVAMQVASSQGSTEALKLFSNLEAPKGIDADFSTKSGIAERNAHHIKEAQDAGLEAQKATKNIDAKLQSQVAEIDGEVNSTYAKNSAGANKGVTPYSTESVTAKNDENIIEVASKDNINIITQATHPYNSDSEENIDHLAKHGTLPESK